MKTRRPKRSCVLSQVGSQRNNYGAGPHPILTRSVMDEITASERRKKKAQLYRIRKQKEKLKQIDPQAQSTSENTSFSRQVVSDIESVIDEEDGNSLKSKKIVQVEQDKTEHDLPKSKKIPSPKQNTGNFPNKTMHQQPSPKFENSSIKNGDTASNSSEKVGLKRKGRNAMGVGDQTKSMQNMFSLKNHKSSAYEESNLQKVSPNTREKIIQPYDSNCSRVLTLDEHKELKNINSSQPLAHQVRPRYNENTKQPKPAPTPVGKSHNLLLPLGVEQFLTHQKSLNQLDSQAHSSLPGEASSHGNISMKRQKLSGQANNKLFSSDEKNSNMSQVAKQILPTSNNRDDNTIKNHYQLGVISATTQRQLANNQAEILRWKNSNEVTKFNTMTSLNAQKNNHTNIPGADTTSRTTEYLNINTQSRPKPLIQENTDNDKDSRKVRNKRVTNALKGVQPLPVHRVSCPICNEMIDSFTIEFHASHCVRRPSSGSRTSDEQPKKKKPVLKQDHNIVYNEKSISKRTSKIQGKDKTSSQNKSSIKWSSSQTPPISQKVAVDKEGMTSEANINNKESTSHFSRAEYVKGISENHSNDISVKKKEKQKLNQQSIDCKVSAQNIEQFHEMKSNKSIHDNLDTVHSSTADLLPEIHSVTIYSTSLDELERKLPQDSHLNIKEIAIDHFLTQKQKLQNQFKPSKKKHINSPILRGETFLEALGIVSKQDMLVQSAFPSIMQTNDGNCNERKWFPEFKVSYDDIVPISLKPYASINDAQVFLKMFKTVAKEAFNVYQSFKKDSTTKTPDFPDPNSIIIEVLLYIQKARDGNISTFGLMKEIKKVICRLTDEIKKKELERGTFLERELSILFEAFLPSHYALKNVCKSVPTNIHSPSLCVRTHTSILWDLDKYTKKRGMKKQELVVAQNNYKQDASSMNKNGGIATTSLFCESTLSTKNELNHPLNTVIPMKVVKQPTKAATQSSTKFPNYLNQNLINLQGISLHSSEASTPQCQNLNIKKGALPNQNQYTSPTITNSPPKKIPPSNSPKNLIVNNDIISTQTLNVTNMNKLSSETLEKKTTLPLKSSPKLAECYKAQGINATKNVSTNNGELMKTNMDLAGNRVKKGNVATLNCAKSNSTNIELNSKDNDNLPNSRKEAGGNQKNNVDLDQLNSKAFTSSQDGPPVANKKQNPTAGSEIVKPKNAFTHFCRVVKPIIRQEIRNQHPSCSSEELKKKVGDEARLRWKELSNADRDIYRKRSRNDHERYNKQLKEL